ncbi:MAG: DNA polymerase/3'-5' exonuclease PolX [Gemmatimonadetes bacterium]|nr:DNA polymerase/3'-5' exonuclease PolX [Gemmatimonadota bacterium]
MENPAIAALFDQMADLLELDGALVFRVRAYRNAARVIRDAGTPLRELAETDPKQLTQLPGIGKDLAGKIREAISHGDFADHRELRAKFPPGLLELLRIQGLGPKRVKQLYDELHLASPDDLRAAIAQGRLVELRGFGQRSVEKLQEQLEKAGATAERRFLLADAEQWATALLKYLGAEKRLRVEAAGSYRRRRETVADLDILVAAEPGEAAGDAVTRFVRYPEIQEVLAQGETKASVRLRGGPQVDLRVVSPEEHGAALMYFTGSKQHNIELRKIAQAKDLKLSEYGLFRGERRVAGATEEEVYAELGLDWIPPELREARGEIELAARHALPDLVTLDHIQGELHAHTNATDGKASLEEMVDGARKLGYRYLAITDHSKRVTMALGLDERRLREQWAQIDELNARLDGFTVLKSIELDILDHGELDLPDDVLAEADYVVASLHYGASKREADNTKRLVTAALHPHVDAIGHPTGQLLGRRDPYPLDFDELVAACVDTGCLLELNGSPERMDLPDHLAAAAAARGVRFVCSTDAHAVSHLDAMRYAVSIARRAGLTKSQVANAGSLAQLRKELKHRSPYRPTQ